MKTSVLCLLCAALALPVLVQSQTEEVVSSRDAKKRIVPGLKVGFNRSNVWDASGESFVADRRGGYAVGGYVAFPLGSLLGVQPELMLQEKGFKGTGRTNEGLPYSISRRTTHLDVPIQFMFKPTRWFTFLIGPQYSYVLKQNDAINIEGNSTQTEKDFGGVNLRRNLFGSLVGFDLNFKHIVLSWRSGWDISTNNGDGTSTAPRYKNHWIQGTIGYRFY